MGRPSTLTPFSSETALTALVVLEKTTLAIPRLCPFGPYTRRTFLTAATVCWK
jgi:hypothetical protein